MISFSDQMKRWARVADRPLNKFEQMLVARPFRYCTYFRTWNRVIKPVQDGFPLGFMELNLSPIPHAWGESYESRVKPMIVRSHSTTMDRRDLFADRLPKPFETALINAVGYEQTQFMLACDLWPLMDLEQFEFARTGPYSGKGGVPFHEFRLRGTEGMAA